MRIIESLADFELSLATELVSLVMLLPSLKYLLRDGEFSFFIIFSYRISIQHRKEPVLAHKWTPIRLHHCSLVFHFLGYFFDMALHTNVFLQVKVIDIDLLIYTLEVNHFSLQCDLIALFRVSLNWLWAQGELMGWVFKIIVFFWFAFGPHFHLDKVARVVNSFALLFGNFCETIVFWGLGANNATKHLVIHFKLVLFFFWQ